MQDEPTALRVPDPGVRALFTEASRWQAWLDVEAALARAEAELGVIPAHAAAEIVARARLELLDREAIRAGLERTGHALVPLIWELDRVCEGDAAATSTGARPRRTSRRPGCCCLSAGHTIPSCGCLPAHCARLPIWPSARAMR
jgi:hypothetical protein